MATGGRRGWPLELAEGRMEQSEGVMGQSISGKGNSMELHGTAKARRHERARGFGVWKVGGDPGVGTGHLGSQRLAGARRPQREFRDMDFPPRQRKFLFCNI